MAKIVKVGELAAMLRISPRRVQQLARLGMPRVTRGKYDPRVCRRSYEATPWRTWAREQDRLSGEITALLANVDFPRRAMVRQAATKSRGHAFGVCLAMER